MLSINFTAIDSGSLCYTNTGLGNVLYQLASQISICKKYNMDLNLFFLEKYVSKLQILGLPNYKETIFRNVFTDSPLYESPIYYKCFKINEPWIYDFDMVNIIKNSNSSCLIIDSYLQSKYYFHEYEKYIQELFKIDNNTLKYIYNKYPQFIVDINNVNKTINISIQIRFEWGYNITYDNIFFYDAIKYFKTKFIGENICFWVFSDNINKAKQLFLNDTLYTFVFCENNLDYVDMWMMSLCDHNIICHSTLGWWGAYLNKNEGKHVLYPSDIFEKIYFKFTNNKEITRTVIKDNIYPNDWIEIESTSLIYK